MAEMSRIAKLIALNTDGFHVDARIMIGTNTNHTKGKGAADFDPHVCGGNASIPMCRWVVHWIREDFVVLLRINRVVRVPAHNNTAISMTSCIIPGVIRGSSRLSALSGIFSDSNPQMRRHQELLLESNFGR